MTNLPRCISRKYFGRGIIEARKRFKQHGILQKKLTVKKGKWVCGKRKDMKASEAYPEELALHIYLAARDGVQHHAAAKINKRCQQVNA